MKEGSREPSGGKGKEANRNVTGARAGREGNREAQFRMDGGAPLGLRSARAEDPS